MNSIKSINQNFYSALQDPYSEVGSITKQEVLAKMLQAALKTSTCFFSTFVFSVGHSFVLQTPNKRQTYILESMLR